MLRELWIRHFAIIEQLQIQFDKGFHVLTGETGAGKSILIDALMLIVGGRASSDYIRHGADKAVVEAVFELEATHPVWRLLAEWGMDEESDTLLIRREITVQGKNHCRLNGRTATVAMLKRLGQNLLDICGQHEHQSLLHTEEQLALIDQFAGEKLLPIRERYQRIFRQYQKTKQELGKWSLNDEELARKMDLYQFQLNEIDEAQLTEVDWSELNKEQNRLAYAEKLLANASQAYDQLDGEGRGLDQIRQALSHIEEVASLDESLNTVQELMQSAYFQMEDVVRRLGDYRDLLEFDPVRLNEIEEQLHLFQHLQRKYGATVTDILKYREKVSAELEQLAGYEEQIESLKQQIVQQEQDLSDLAGQLTVLRKAAASQLETRVETELSDLQMGSTIFHIAFVPISLQKTKYREYGQDEISLQIAPNPGEPLRSLAKIASGGELSRIMLALKSVFYTQQDVGTLVFDEVDTGVSGRAAQAIAEKIARLTSSNQVFSVTHLPQVACMADHHFFIYKEISDNSTHTKVKQVTGVDRAYELARMLGGVEVTNTTLQHAQEMLELAGQVKSQFVNRQ